MPQASRYVPSFPAYEAFLRGRHHFALQTAPSLPRAIESYRRATELDPGYAEPHVQLAATYLLLWFFGLKSASEMTPLIQTEATHALRGDPMIARLATAILGAAAAASDYDWTEAARLLERGLSGQVGVEAEARWCYGTFHLIPRGRFDDALALFDDVLQDGDPLNVVWRVVTVGTLNLAGRHEQAFERLRDVFDISRTYWVSHLYLAECHAARDQWDAAREAAEEAYRLAPWNARTHGMLAATLMRTGATGRARELTAGLETSVQQHWAPEGMVLYHLLMKDVDGAAAWYHRAIDQRDIWVLVQARGWLARELRASTHGPVILKRLNLDSSERHR
jgi:tetratricopeptide (TPR) repeat protein